MMKRNKELDEAYLSFINDLMLLIRETQDLTKEKNKLIQSHEKRLNRLVLTPNVKLHTSEKNRTLRIDDERDEGDIIFSDNPFPLIDKSRDIKRMRKLTHNANFLYCFALFENFASKLVRITFKYGGQSKDSPKQRYKNRFAEFAKKSSEKRDHRYTDMLMSEQKMITNYDDLPETMSLWTYMFGVNKEGIYKKHIFRYTEARERRNLLIHRSIYADERYKNSFIKAHMKPDNGKKAKEFLELTFRDYSNEEKPKKFDMTVTPSYLLETFSMLVVMSSLFYMSSFKLNKNEIEESSGSIFPNSVFHSLMCCADDLHDDFTIIVLIDIVLEYYKNIAQRDWKKVPALEKMNLMILFDHQLMNLIDLRSNLNKKTKKNEKKLHYLNKLINDRKEILKYFKNEFDPTIHKEDKSRWNLLDSHINRDIEGLIKNSKKAKIDHKELEEWFMFREYQKDEKFQEFYESIKPKKEHRKMKMKGPRKKI